MISAGTKIWEDFLILRKGNCDISRADSLISGKLIDFDELVVNHGHLVAYRQVESLPEVKKKINAILRDRMAKGTIQSWFIRYINHWLDDDLKIQYIHSWLNDDEYNYVNIDWLLTLVHGIEELHIQVFNKLVGSYKSNKTKEMINTISYMFKIIDSKHIDEACKTLSKATPAVSACLLSRGDIKDEYIINGLKSLSKLSKQRTIEIEIDFNMLSVLGPKSRLDAMKQLVGLFHKWRGKKIKKIPFKQIPTKDEVSKFLFPCSLKYNKEVVDVINKFDELTKPIN